MPSKRLARLLAPLVPIAILASIALAFLLIRRHPLGIAHALAGGALAVVIGWIVVSVLWPARAERRCPQCGAESLGRSDPRTTVGIVCSRCGFEDSEASAWLFAEEEGPLERTVLEERTGRRRKRAARDVDIPTAPD